MIDLIRYRVNRSSATDIATHLSRVDASFQPILSMRVDIPAYAKKLHDKAFRFEAWLSQDLVGLVATYCNQSNDGKAFVSSVSVWPECQGEGIASHLIQQCIDHLEIQGFYFLDLEVDKRSLSAVSLYRKLGFNTLQRNGNLLLMEMSIERKK